MMAAMQKHKLLDGVAVKAELGRIAALSQTRKFDEAEARARALHKAGPARGDVNDTLSLVLADRRKLHEALPYAKAAVAAEPNHSPAPTL